MERKRTQKLLKSQLGFRGITFFLAFICIITGIWFIFCQSDLSGIFIGIGGSALVWSVVETIDFFLKTSYQYELDRNNFIRILDESRITITARLKNAIEEDIDVPWSEIYNDVYNLYNEMAKYSSNNSLYTLSKEFYDISQYIIRAFWLLDSNIYFPSAKNKHLTKDSEEYQHLYNQFVIEETERKTVELSDIATDWNQRRLSRLQQKKITLSFKPYNPGNAISIKSIRGGLYRHETTDLRDSPIIETTELKTFRPYKEIEEHMTLSKKFGVVRTVLTIALRKLEEYY